MCVLKGKYMITLKNVFKSYKNKYTNLDVLNDVSFSIKKECIIAITGKSGSGKSTLMNMMYGIEKPDKGSIIIENTDITTLSLGKLSEFRLNNFGYVFQDFQLISTLNTIDNIIMPAYAKKKKYDPKLLDELLEFTDLKDKDKSFPFQLSGGEKQRVAIARAMITKPKIIFADEPTGNLDEENTVKIMEYLVKGARKNKNIFIYVTHDLELCKYADIVLNIKNKKVTYEKGAAE